MDLDWVLILVQNLGAPTVALQTSSWFWFGRGSWIQHPVDPTWLMSPDVVESGPVNAMKELKL